MKRGEMRDRDLLASPTEPAIEPSKTLSVAPGKLSLDDAAALGDQLSVSPGKVSRVSMMAVQMRAVQRVPGEDGDEGGDHFVPVSRETLAQIDELLGDIGASREDVPSHEVIATTTAAENSRGETPANANVAWNRRQLDFEAAAREDAAREEPAQEGAPHATQSPAAPEEEREQMTPNWGLAILIANYNHWTDLPQVARMLREGSGFQDAMASASDRVINRPDRTGQQMYDDIFSTIWDLSMAVEQGHVAHLTVYVSGHGGSDGVFGIDERDGPSLTPDLITRLGRMGAEHNVHVTFIIDSCNIGLVATHAQANMSRDLEEDIDDNRTDAAQLRQRLSAARDIGRFGFGMSRALLELYDRRPLRTAADRTAGARFYQQYQTALAGLEEYLGGDHPGAPDLANVQSRIGRARSTFDRVADQVNNNNMQTLRTATAPLLDAINDAINANLVSVREQLGTDANPHAGRALGNPQQGAGQALGNPSQGAGRALGDPVQRAQKRGEHADDLGAAESGVSGGGSQMPYFAEIQQSFGRHDVGAIRAHTDSKAQDAASALGARAYATGSDVAFGENPDLHTAAHEAAHVVQQRGGVQLAGGFGETGDRYERHADQVADAVVAGKSAEGLLDQMAPSGPTHGSSVQRAVQLDIDDRIDRYVHEDGAWRRDNGRPINAVDRQRIRRLLGERVRSDTRMPPEYRRAYQEHLRQENVEPQPPHVFLEQSGAALDRTRQDQQAVAGAMNAANADSDALSAESPGRPIRRPLGGNPNRLEPTGLSPRVLGTSGTHESTSLEGPQGETIANVRMGDVVSNRGADNDDQILHSGGFEACTGFSTQVNGADGSHRELGHVAASDQRGAYPHLLDSLANNLPEGGGTINTHVNTHPDTRGAPESDTATPMPPDHTTMMRQLRTDLQQRLGSDHRVRQDGNSLVVTNPNGEQTRINVGVDERPVDQGSTRMTSGREGLHVQTGDNDPDIRDHATAARAGHDEPRQRARRIRGALAQRIASDPEGPNGRQATLARMAQRDLDSAPATAEHVDRVAQTASLSDDEIAQARPVRPQTRLEDEGGADEISPPTNYDPRQRRSRPRGPTTVAGSDADEPAIAAPSDYGVLMVGDDPPGTDTERTSRRAAALRRDLEIRRRHAPNRQARQAAERGLASLDRAGDQPSERQLQHVANQAGTDLDEAERHGERAAPTPESPTGELGTDNATLSARGVSGNARVNARTGELRGGVTVPTAGRTRTRVRASGGRTADGGSRQGVDGQVTVPTGTGRSASLQGGVVEERDAGGNLRGRDRSGGASFDGGSVGLGVTVGSGWRCYASRVHQDASNPQHFTIPWRLQITREFGAELEIRIGGGFSVGDELERSGVHAIDASGSSPEAIEAARTEAEEWQRSFHSMNRDRVDSLFAEDPTTGGHANHDIEYWRDAPVGESERVRSQSTLGASITVPLGQYLEVGGGYEHQGSESSQIAKHSAETIRVTQTVGSRAGADGTVGAMGTSMTMGERDIRISRVVVEANLTSAEGQITQFLATGRTLRPGQTGVQLIEILPTTGTAESTGIHFLGLGGTTEGQLTRTRGVRRNPETGELEEVDQFEGQHNEQQSGLAGMRQQSNTTVTAPTGADEDYVITQTIQGNREQAVRNELAETTGNSRRDVSDTNVVNGTWNVSERFTQAQISTFCTRFMQRHREIDRARGRDPDERVSFFGIELEPTGAYDTLYRRLSAINPSPSGEEEEQQARAQRGEAIGEFLQATGQEGVRLIRASAGGGQQVITRTRADGEADTNFMSVEERQRLDTAIERWNGQIEALGQRGGPLNQDTDRGDADGLDSTGDIDVLRTQITNELTQMRARREAMMNEHSYRSLPRPERLEIDHDYEVYVGQLESLLTRLQGGRDAAVAAAFGEETQAEQREMEATRLRATETRSEVQALREHTLLYRRRFGQIDSETWEYRLNAEDNRRSNRMFRTAETARTQAEEYMTIGANRTNEEDGPEWGATSTSAYRLAAQQYQRAVEEFEAARTVLTRLNRVYAAALRDPDQTEPDATDASATPGATPNGDADAEASGDEERAERRRRRRRQRRARNAEQPASETRSDSDSTTADAETEEEPSSGTRMGPQIRFPRHLFDNCLATGRSVTSRVNVLDPGPIDLPGGGSLFIISAVLAPQVGQSAVTEQLGPNETVFHVTFEVQDPVPNCDFYTVVGSTSGPVINRFGERLRAYVRAHDNN